MLFKDRPLDPGRLDADLYTPRPLLESSLLRRLREGRNVLLAGAAGSGKTTLMRQLRSELEAAETRTAWVNAALADTAEDFLEAARAELGRDQPPSPSPIEAPAQARLLSLSRALAGYPPTVIFVDGLIDAGLGFELFGRLRDELWAAGHTWLVAASPRDSAVLRKPPAEAFWSAVVEIPTLSYAEVMAFLERGLDSAERERIAEDTPRAGLHPRLLIREVDDALAAEPGERRAQIGAMIERASAVGRSEGMAMAELFALARPVSAHDPEVLERLGWSRAYAQRIFSHLEREGLVRSISVASEGAGRPRKLYEPEPGAIA
jgi:energy-coupling factor transporter ATP-binding protein EcfA2